MGFVLFTALVESCILALLVAVFLGTKDVTSRVTDRSTLRHVRAVSRWLLVLVLLQAIAVVSWWRMLSPLL